MWSTLEIRSGTQLGHDWWAGHCCIGYCLISLKFEKLTTKIREWYSNRQNSIELWVKNIKRYLWLKNKERKFHFQFAERRFLAAICDLESGKSARASPSPHHTLVQEPFSPPAFCCSALIRWFLSIALRIPTAHDFCVISARKWAVVERVHIHNIIDFPQAKLGRKISASFLWNKQGYLYFLFHNFNKNRILNN